MSQLSLRQLSLRYTLIVLYVIVLLSLLSFFLFRAWTVQYQTNEIEQSLRVKVDDISHLVGFYRSIVKKLAQQQKVVDLLQFGNEKEAFDWALGMQDLLPQNIGLTLFDTKGDVLGNPMDLRLGERCIADIQGHIHGMSLREVPVHQSVASLEHFDVMENVVVDDQVVGVVFASFSLDILQEELTRITGRDDVLVVYSSDMQVIAQSGDIGQRPVLLQKMLPIAGTGWGLQVTVAEPRLETLMLGTGLVALLMFLLVSLIWYGFARYMVRIFSSDLDSIQQLLVHVKSSNEPQRDEVQSSLRETEHIVRDIHQLAEDISFYHKRLVDFSVTDELTGLFNRRAFNQQAIRCVELARRGVDVSLVLMDMDYFKQANDAFGHAMGDDLLKNLGRCLRRNVRATDIAARLGGDEFAVILVQCTEDKAFKWYSKVAMEFEMDQKEMFAVEDGVRMCSISAGFACLTKDDEDIAEVLKRADAALYKAKGSGRGRMVS